jgi:Cu/Ag efflux pump CusA
MVGGLVTSTVLTLVVLPALYLIWKGGRATLVRSEPGS